MLYSIKKVSFKVAGHLKHHGAIPNPPVWLVENTLKTAWQPIY